MPYSVLFLPWDHPSARRLRATWCRSATCAALLASVFVLGACGAGGPGGPSAVLQDDDGNGTGAPVCADALWWDLEFQYRFALEISNPNPTPLPAGSPAYAAIDHAALVRRGLALISGRDLRLVYWDGVDNVEVPRTALDLDQSDTELRFPLAAELEALAVAETGYFVYYGNIEAGSPPVAKLPAINWAHDTSDDSSLLQCDDQLASAFYSLQLRQTGNTKFEVFGSHRTGDSTAYAILRVTDDLTGEVLFEKTYGAAQHTGTFSEGVVIESPLFTVYLESMEFSASARIFGCKTYSTWHPPTSRVGSNTISYIQVLDAVAEPCGL